MKSAEISIFGVPLWYKSNTPRTVISPAVQPGECWSFQGFPGYLVLKLNNNVYVTGFTLEHIPKSLAPNGRIDSAPKIFTVWVIIANYLIFFNCCFYFQSEPSFIFFKEKKRGRSIEANILSTETIEIETSQLKNMFLLLQGLETVNDGEPFQFGEYEFLENGTSLQYFPVQNYDSQTVRSHNLVELRIESNHGNNNYTCLYRFRVHGTLTPSLS